MQREGIFREMKLRGHYEKPSEKRAREKAEAIRRARKLARKKLQREGLLPMKPSAGSGGHRQERARAPPSLLISELAWMWGFMASKIKVTPPKEETLEEEGPKILQLDLSDDAGKGLIC